MKAAILEKGQVRVGDLPDPRPRKGQALVRTHRCALCASDAHFLSSGATIIARSKKHNGPYAGVDLDRPIVMGHEFVGEILDYGPGSRRSLRPGSKVTAIPVMQLEGGSIGIVGYTNECPGGFGQYMLLDEEFLLEVPSELDEDLAALIEPLAVGIEHARAGRVQQGEVPLVLGCGAIGLAVIAGLKLMGIAPIIGADLDAGRRAMAVRMGADVAVHPHEVSAYGTFRELGGRAPNVVFECVGKAGILASILEQIVPGGRIVMGGYCLDPEELYVPLGQMKGLQINFGGGEHPEDMIAARDAIVSGKVDVGSWLGPGIGLCGVQQALKDLTKPTSPIRTVVDPWHA
jgi:threonine dehydrogenase-like Zn-dependent dehydrogenase